jgi:hypothetical protein
MINPKMTILAALTGLMMAGCSSSAPTTTTHQATAVTPQTESQSYGVQQYGYRMPPRYGGSRSSRCGQYCRSTTYGYYAFRRCMVRCQTGGYRF